MGMGLEKVAESLWKNIEYFRPPTG